ncbi:MAG: hypothetical protein ACEPOW_04965 [Bacteroidales bacterium]
MFKINPKILFKHVIFYCSCLLLTFLLKNSLQIVFVCLLEIPYTIEKYSLSFPIDTPKWSIGALIFIFFGWIIVFFLFAIRVLFKSKHIDKLPIEFHILLKAYLFISLWNIMIGDVIGGLTFNYGLGFLTSWLYWSDTIELLVSFFMFFLIPVGVMVFKHYITKTNTRYQHQNRYKKKLRFEKHAYYSTLLINIPLAYYIYYFLFPPWIFSLLSVQLFSYILFKERKSII